MNPPDESLTSAKKGPLKVMSFTYLAYVSLNESCLLKQGKIVLACSTVMHITVRAVSFNLVTLQEFPGGVSTRADLPFVLGKLQCYFHFFFLAN